MMGLAITPAADLQEIGHRHIQSAAGPREQSHAVAAPIANGQAEASTAQPAQPHSAGKACLH